MTAVLGRLAPCLGSDLVPSLPALGGVRSRLLVAPAAYVREQQATLLIKSL